MNKQVFLVCDGWFLIANGTIIMEIGEGLVTQRSETGSQGLTYSIWYYEE